MTLTLIPLPPQKETSRSGNGKHHKETEEGYQPKILYQKKKEKSIPKYFKFPRNALKAICSVKGRSIRSHQRRTNIIVTLFLFQQLSLHYKKGNSCGYELKNGGYELYKFLGLNNRTRNGGFYRKMLLDTLVMTKDPLPVLNQDGGNHYDFLTGNFSILLDTEWQTAKSFWKIPSNLFSLIHKYKKGRIEIQHIFIALYSLIKQEPNMYKMIRDIPTIQQWYLANVKYGRRKKIEDMIIKLMTGMRKHSVAYPLTETENPIRVQALSQTY